MVTIETPTVAGYSCGLHGASHVVNSATPTGGHCLDPEKYVTIWPSCSFERFWSILLPGLGVQVIEVFIGIWKAALGDFSGLGLTWLLKFLAAGDAGGSWFRLIEQGGPSRTDFALSLLSLSLYIYIYLLIYVQT